MFPKNKDILFACILNLKSKKDILYTGMYRVNSTMLEKGCLWKAEFKHKNTQRYTNIKHKKCTLHENMTNQVSTIF